jgi:hypothetical protein
LNNQQQPIESTPLPEVHAYTQNKPKFDGGPSKTTHPQGNSKKGKKTTQSQQEIPNSYFQQW